MHAPVPGTWAQSSGPQGYVIEDGHRLFCEHSKVVVANHVIFIIDCSGSMDEEDSEPTILRLQRLRIRTSTTTTLDICVCVIKTRMQWSLQDVVSSVLSDHNLVHLFHLKENRLRRELLMSFLGSSLVAGPDTPLALDTAMQRWTIFFPKLIILHTSGIGSDSK
jgi:hypothetical protein